MIFESTKYPRKNNYIGLLFLNTELLRYNVYNSKSKEPFCSEKFCVDVDIEIKKELYRLPKLDAELLEEFVN